MAEDHSKAGHDAKLHCGDTSKIGRDAIDGVRIAVVIHVTQFDAIQETDLVVDAAPALDMQHIDDCNYALRDVHKKVKEEGREETPAGPEDK